MEHIQLGYFILQANLCPLTLSIRSAETAGLTTMLNSARSALDAQLKDNEKKSEKFREELMHKITSSEFRELMELEYRIGKLELDNMELEQSRIVHETIVHPMLKNHVLRI